MSAQGVVISRLRLRGAAADPLAARLRIASALSATDLSPAGLPAAAIVIIRMLHDPLPGRLGLARASHMPPLAWQQAVATRIGALACAAARPAHGFVPESAEAVWFNDRSELLACLARDWREGAIRARWWWRTLLLDSDGARAVVAEWLRSPEYVPAAMEQLATARQAVSFVQCLDENSLTLLLERVMERFGLAQLRPLLIGSESITAPPGNAAQLVKRESIPWLPWVPEAAEATLKRKQSDLLGIALLLQRAPRAARSAALIEAIQRAQRGALQRDGEQIFPARQIVVGGDDTERGSAPAVPGVRSGVAHGQETAQGEPPIPSRELDSIPVGITHGPPATAGFAQPVIAESVPISATLDSPLARAAGQPAITTAGAGPAITAAVAGAQPATAATVDHHSEPDLAQARSVETGYGGVLFLINLGLFLDLYGDFSQPAKPGIELPIWDFVALLGEALAGAAIREDPLWPLLAELAARESAQEPGLHFAPSPEWRVPEHWLAPFAAATAWEWSGRERRLQVRHPAGFVVLDVAVPERNYRDALAVQLASYRIAGRCAGSVRCAPRAGGLKRAAIRGRALRRWCTWLLPYAHARLQAALGVTAAEVGKLVCTYQARLRVSATHLDAHFALAHLPIEVRIAGLDRDPGWVPAAGRYVKFHFD